MVAAAVPLLYAICMYKDYEILNHRMLLTLMDRISNMKMQNGAWLYGLIQVTSSDPEPFAYDFDRSIIMNDWYHQSTNE
ncbi:hypothetical protein TanjilG_27236 [Lupinus angustifolius]|uniref:Uncharacterized protein n=1 Tax=Lupinus angustifolius TaxID=3871 RepID=A0A394D8B9_LUPAN|nr:hypothetical protein TanjilG_27236 [Lupinus angustifolius]